MRRVTREFVIGFFFVNSDLGRRKWQNEFKKELMTIFSSDGGFEFDSKSIIGKSMFLPYMVIMFRSFVKLTHIRKLLFVVVFFSVVK